MNIYQHFQSAARQHPEHIAIIENERSITFGELQLAIEKTAAQFKAEGLRPGDRVLVFVPMGVDLYRIVLALFKIGATAVFLDEWVSWKRLILCCQLANCRGFIGIKKARLLAWLIGPLRKIPVKPRPDRFQAYAPDAAVENLPESHPALITFTTGSTGTPKAALRSHGFLHQQFEVLREEIEPRPGDRNMVVLPIVLLINLGAGATSVIATFKASKPQQMKPERIAAQIEGYGINRLIASPYFVRRLAEYALAQKITLPSLKTIFTGGAPVFPAEAQLFCRAFPDTEANIAYGSTEAEPISLISAAHVAEKAGEMIPSALPVGETNRHIEVKIIPVREDAITWEAEAGFVTCAEGEVGEIVVAGPHVLAAYYNNEEALRRNKIFEPNGKAWHRTGDSGYLLGNQLFLTGRCSTLFHSGGQLICPFLYENWLQQIPGVVMGTLMQLNGNPVFFVELQKGRPEKPVREAVAGLGLESAELRFIHEMPRDPRHHSKIDYERLKARSQVK